MKKAALGVVAVLGMLAAGLAWSGPAHGEPVRAAVLVNRAVVSGGDTDTYQEHFRGGRPARVRVAGGPGTVLRLEVRDQFGNLIGSDTDLGSPAEVTFTPRWTGSFTIKVINLGRAANPYVIRMD
jgi:hypothetical protein